MTMWEGCGPCPLLCEFYPGVCLTTEEKARKNFSKARRRVPVGTTCHSENLQNTNTHGNTVSCCIKVVTYKQVTNERETSFYFYRVCFYPVSVECTFVHIRFHKTGTRMSIWNISDKTAPYSYTILKSRG